MICQNLYKPIGLQNSFFRIILNPMIKKLVSQIKLLELHLFIGFTKFFIEHNFICRGDIRTYHDLLNGRAGLSKCEARLEALLGGPTLWRVQTFEDHQTIMMQIVTFVKERGLKG